MGLLSRLFGRGNGGPEEGDDAVWLSHAARLRGLQLEAAEHAKQGRSVLVVALSLTALDELAAALAPLAPKRCADVFERDSLRQHLGRPGAVAVALPGALPTDATIPGEPPLELLVCGRNDRRRADEAIAGVAGLLSPDACVTFHLTLDDPLIARFGAGIKPLIEKLGMTEDEAIRHSMVTRAIASAQRKSAGA